MNPFFCFFLLLTYAAAAAAVAAPYSLSERFDPTRCGKDTICMSGRCDRSNRTCTKSYQMKRVARYKYHVLLELNYTNHVRVINRPTVRIMNKESKLKCKRSNGKEVVNGISANWTRDACSVIISLDKGKTLLDDSTQIILNYTMDGKEIVTRLRAEKNLQLMNTLKCAFDTFGVLKESRFPYLSLRQADTMATTIECSRDRRLLIARKGSSKFVKIDKIVCEDNAWHTVINSAGHDNLAEFVDESRGWSESVSDPDLPKRAYPEKVDIACGKQVCTACTPPWRHKCANCTAVQYRAALTPDECATLTCPARHHLVHSQGTGVIERDRIPQLVSCGRGSKGKVGWVLKVEKTTKKSKGKGHNLTSTVNQPLNRMACKYVSPEKLVAAALSDGWSFGDDDGYDVAVVASRMDARKKPPKKKKEEEETEEEGSSDWLANNWITYLLTPFLVIVAFVGCIALFSFVLRTKEAHEAYLREERRRTQQREEHEYRLQHQLQPLVVEEEAESQSQMLQPQLPPPSPAPQSQMLQPQLPPPSPAPQSQMQMPRSLAPQSPLQQLPH